MLSSFSGDSTPTGKGELEICCFCKKQLFYTMMILLDV